MKRSAPVCRYTARARDASIRRASTATWRDRDRWNAVPRIGSPRRPAARLNQIGDGPSCVNSSVTTNTPRRAHALRMHRGRGRLVVVGGHDPRVAATAAGERRASSPAGASGSRPTRKAPVLACETIGTGPPAAPLRIGSIAAVQAECDGPTTPITAGLRA